MEKDTLEKIPRQTIMSKITPILIIFLALLGYPMVQAQNIPLINPDTLNQISPERYEGGEDAFYRFILRNVKYPKEARLNYVSGTAIIAIVISPEGKIKLLDMLNPLENGIEEEIIRLMSTQEAFWKPNVNARDEVYILPLIFKLAGFENKRNRLHPNPPTFLLEPCVVLATGTGGGDFDFQYYTDFEAKFIKYEKKSKYRKALAFLNRMIALEPYNKQLHLQRIDLESNLAIRVRTCLDLRFISYLLKKPIPDDYQDIQKECISFNTQRR